MNITDTLFALYKHFKLRTPPRGFCKGFALSWLEAILLSEKQRSDFDAQSKEISHYPLEKLIQLSLEKTPISDLVFRIFSYQEPRLLNKNLNGYSKLNLVSPHVSTAEMKNKGGLEEIYSEPYIFNQREFINLLTDLTQLFDSQSDQNEPVGILCSSALHSHALAYRSKKGWSSRDINDKEIKIDLNPQEIGPNSFNYLSLNSASQSSQYASFELKIIVSGSNKNKENLKNAFNLLKSHRQITKEIAFRNSHGIDLFFIAASHGNIEIVKQLLPYKVDLNRRDERGNTACMLAAKSGDLTMLDLLRVNGADLNLMPNSGTTLMHIATSAGNLSLLKFLGKLNFPFDRKDNSGNAPIHFAVISRNASMIRFMAESGTILNVQNGKGLTPMFIACALRHEEVISVLEEYGEIRITSDPALKKDKEISLLLYFCKFLDEISLLAFFIPIIGQIYLGARVANDFEPLTKGNYSFLVVINLVKKIKVKI